MNYYELPYQSRTWYYGNGAQKDFAVTFSGGPPLAPSHVRVFLGGSELTTGWSLVTVSGQTYVRFNDAPGYPDDGDPPNVMLKRVTPTSAYDRVVDFTDGTVLDADVLDKAQLNSLYVSQESSDLFLDQGGAAVNITQPQTIGGDKTFTDNVIIDSDGGMQFKPNTPLSSLVGGTQWVLAASDADGNVTWERPLISASSLPNNVVLTDSPTSSAQTITAPKRFDGQVTVLNGNLKVEGTGTINKAVVATDNNGTTSLQPIVNGIRLGSDSAAVSTGVITISPESIKALAANTSGGSQTVSANVVFQNNVNLGNNAAADKLTIDSTIYIPTGAELGKVLTCTGANGSASWANPAATGITSVNNKTGSGSGGAVTLTASDVGAVSVGETQNIDGAKTFTNNVNLGVDQFDIITVNGEFRIPGGTAGQVLMQTAAGKAIWQNATAAGVSSINNQTGAVTISAASLGAYTSTTIPTATTTQKGIMQVGSGLSVTDGVVSVNQNATLPQATADTLGGIKVGSGLSINTAGVLSATLNGNVGVNKFNNRVGDVVPVSGDYTAAQVTNAVDTNTAQTISASKKFSATQSVTASSGTVGTNGQAGVLLDPSGVIKAQASSGNTHVFEAISPAGGTVAWIDSDGDATFSGLVYASTGFESPGGLKIGQNTTSGIDITGTLTIKGNGTPGAGKVLTCTNTNGNVEWQVPSNAPVTDVNGLTGNVKINLDGESNPGQTLNGVTKGTAQVISGSKTFSVNQTFSAGVTLGSTAANAITISGTPYITQNATNGKVLTCTNTATGEASWQPAPVVSVKGDQGTAKTGEVTLTASDFGAATTAQLTTVSNAASAAQTTANSASTTANNALTTAQSKLTSVSTTTTPNPGGTGSLTCLSGSGTAASPLQVLGASPLGTAGGALSGSYPNPGIAAKAVTFAKIQDINPQKLLGGPTTGTAVDQVREISLGTGLGFVDGNLTNTSIPTVSASTANTFSSTNTFNGNVTVGAAYTTTLNGPLVTTGTTTLGNEAADTVEIKGPLKYTGSTGAAGKVLTSDASGNATWQPPAVTNTFVPTIDDVGSVCMARLNAGTGGITVLEQTNSGLLIMTTVSSSKRLSTRAGGGTWIGVQLAGNTGTNFQVTDFKTITVSPTSLLPVSSIASSSYYGDGLWLFIKTAN